MAEVDRIRAEDTEGFRALRVERARLERLTREREGRERWSGGSQANDLGEEGGFYQWWNEPP